MKPHIFIDDEDAGEADFALGMKANWLPPASRDSTKYVTGLRETSLSIEVAGVRLEDLVPVNGVPRNVTFSQEYRWSRWRRWLNAVLRVAWWPLGPPRLSKSWGLDVSEMYVTLAELQADGTMRVEMSSRPDRPLLDSRRGQIHRGAG